MEDDRLYFIISIPIEFKDKFHGFLKNINTINIDKDPPVKIEGIYIKKFVALPKQKEKDDENG